jgi:hypothetical protein
MDQPSFDAANRFAQDIDPQRLLTPGESVSCTDATDETRLYPSDVGDPGFPYTITTTTTGPSPTATTIWIGSEQTSPFLVEAGTQNFNTNVSLFVEKAHLVDRSCVVTALPDTQITKRKVKSKKRTAKVSFTGTERPSAYECALGKPKKKGAHKHKKPKLKFKPCGSPTKVKRLKPGMSVFQVRAVNGTGADPTPATVKLKVKRSH